MKRNKKPTTNNHHTDPTPASAASTAELRDFLDRMKGKDPEEVLGSASGHRLAVAMIQATVITLVAMASLTVGPYLYSQSQAAASAEPSKEAPPPSAEPEKKTSPPTTAPATPAAVKTTQPEKSIPDKLGATDVKPANPKTNPLDKSTDDLFKDLDKK